MKRIIYIVCMELLLTSCYVREVELDYPPVPHRIVLNASVSPEHDVAAFVSKTWFMLDSMPDAWLPDVTITVSVNGTYKGLMECIDNPSDSTIMEGQYRLAGCSLKAGDHLRLEASAPGYETVSAEVSVPAFHPIESTDTASFVTTSPYSPSRQGFRFIAGIKKVLPGHNYYRMLLEQQTEFERNGERIILSTFGKSTYQDYAEAYLIVDYEDPLFRISDVPSGSGYNYNNGLFTDNLLDEQEEYLLRLSLLQYDKSYRSDTLSAIVTYKVHLLTISESYYQYFRALESMGVWIGIGDSNWADIGEREETYTNVHNGFGVVTAYQQDIRSFCMPDDTIPPGWDPWNGFNGNPYNR